MANRKRHPTGQPQDIVPDTLNPVEILRASLRATHTNKIAGSLFLRWPTMKDSSQKLAAMLTRLWPDPEDMSRPLLDRCLADALREAERVFHDEGEFEEKNVFMNKITDGLVASLALSLGANTSRGMRVYDPFESTLVEWLDRYKPKTLNFDETLNGAMAIPEVRILCAARVFSLRDMAMAGLIQKGQSQ